ncbi:dTDP-glucose 4,6-dehydratase [Streptomyces sp. cg35]|uniref:dTDP-glucose 4,6-dehydratase n=1 Tax=Streptomyces sp. cg35 TaxID=3421650 RepID=UPI003D164186
MRVLVTGGAGFIGSHLVRSLLSPSDARGAGPDVVTVLDALTYAGNRANLGDAVRDRRLRFVHGDILDIERVTALMADHDAVVHLAAESHVDRSIDSGRAFAATNVLGTQTLLEAAVRAPHPVTFLHISTDEVYGSIPAGSWSESRPLEPASPYSAAKAGSDLLALAYHRTHGLDVRITRCSNNYGSYQFPEKIIPLFVTNLLRGRSVPLYGDGGQVRDWLHVEDHCRAIRLVLEGGRPGEVYNVGGGLELTNRQLTERILAACDADWTSVEHVADRPGHDARYSVDWSKIRDELGYAPRRTFDEGLAATVDWYRTHRSWWEPLVGARPALVRE